MIIPIAARARTTNSKGCSGLRARARAGLSRLFGSCCGEFFDNLVVVRCSWNRGGDGLVGRSRFYARGGVMNDCISLCTWLAFSGAMLFLSFLLLLPAVD